MAATFYERKALENYTLGGVRLFVNELKDSSTTPPKYAGFVDLGCVEEGPIAQEIEFQEHFCTATGTRVKDRKIVKQVSQVITVTLVEPDVENLRLFFLGGAVAEIAAAVGGGSVVDEVVQLNNFERRMLKHGRNATAVVVTHFSGAPTYVLGTDYEIVDWFGRKAVRRVTGGAIADGEFVKVDYTFDVLESRNFNPLTSILKTGQVIFAGVSDTGNEIEIFLEKCNVNPSGDFNWNNDDWTTFQLEIDVLDDSAANPTAPFGVLKNYGTGQNI